MNVLEGIEEFKDGLMWICLSALGLCLVGCIGFETFLIQNLRQKLDISYTVALQLPRRGLL